jgi:tagaturonate reductase
LNREGGEYSVSIVKPIKMGDLTRFAEQGNSWNVVLRGFEGVSATKVSCVGEMIDIFTDDAPYFALAKDKELRVIVSNTTEAGIRFDEGDRLEAFPDVSYPAKLTRFLMARYEALGDEGGVYLMPVELIDKNADNLFACVEKYAELWGLSEDFKRWNREKNFYCNTLVDRIVSGYPKTEEDVKSTDDAIGYHDPLVTIGEHFGLWAVEKKGEIDKYIIEGHHGIDVVLAPSIDYYKKRKVRVLNGSHTNLVAYGLLSGMQTVYDCMNDEKLLAFVSRTLEEEINPFVSSDLAATRAFADEVVTRFKNPYLNHRLISISLNSISKWAARDLPSFDDYYKTNGKIPECLTLGFSYLMALYLKAEKSGDAYTVSLPYGVENLIDTPEYLEYFTAGGSVKAFMARADVFGADLTKYEGFYEAVLENLAKIMDYAGE